MFVTTASAATLVIDDFATPNPGQKFFILGPPGNSNPDPYLMKHQASSIAGGERDVFIDVLGSAQIGSALGIVGRDMDSGAEAMQIATSPGPGSSVTLQYDGIDPDAGGLTNGHGLNLDLTGGGTNTQLLMHVVSSDAQGGMQLDITVTSPSGLSSVFHGNVNDDGKLYDYVLPFSQFVGNASFSNVDSMTFVFNGIGTRNVDFKIDLIHAIVPEPSSVALLGAGAVGLVFCAARRRKPRSL
jgi:hypothetical protein